MTKNEILTLKEMLENENIPFTYRYGGTFGNMPEDMDYQEIFYPQRPNSLIGLTQTKTYRDRHGLNCGLSVNPWNTPTISPKKNQLYILCREKSIRYPFDPFHYISVKDVFEIIKNHYEKELAE